MALTGPALTPALPGIGPDGARPARGSDAANAPAGNRRTAAFADMYQANARASAPPPATAPAASARTGARPDLPTEVAVDIAAEIRTRAEDALAVSLRTGKVLRTVIEASLTSPVLSGRAPAGPSGPQGADAGPDDSRDWRRPLG